MDDNRTAPLFLSAETVAALHALRDVAGGRPIDMLTRTEAIKTPKGKKAHMKQMAQQSTRIPGP
jgi:hypothetical protein